MKNQIKYEELTERTDPKTFNTRGEYFRDQTMIIHSMAFRRLKHKTQVFFSPTNDHICTRIEHVLHVATIAATCCKGLNEKQNWDLNIDLAYAIGLGHDLGHAPFGHAGEKALSECLGIKFRHELNGYRVVEHVANKGKGLNLTFAVKDGIMCHNGENFEQRLMPSEYKNDLSNIRNLDIRPSTIEGCIVRFADKIAYLGRDIEDAIVSSLIKDSDIPSPIRKALGSKNGEIIDSLVTDLIENSDDNGIGFSDKKFDLLIKLRDFNYNKIYNHAKLTEYKKFVSKIIASICSHHRELFCRYGLDYKAYENEPLTISKRFGSYLKKMNDLYIKEDNVPNQILSDYISGMTDSYAIRIMKDISLPSDL